MSDFNEKQDVSLDSILDDSEGTPKSRESGVQSPKSDSDDFESPISRHDNENPFEDKSFEDHRLGQILDHPPGSVKIKHLESKMRSFLENIVQGEGKAHALEPMEFPSINVVGNISLGASGAAVLSAVGDNLTVNGDLTVNGQFSEVGVTRGLVSWLPLIGDTKDRVTNEVATNNGATPVGDGYEFDGSGEIDGSPTGSYIAIPEAITNTSNYPQGCTYSVWLNVDTDAVDRMSLFRGGGSINHIEIRSISKNFRTEAATQNGYSFGSGNFPDDVRGVWSNFTIVFANGETGRPVRWYQNGKLFHTGSMTGGSNPEGEHFSFNGLGRATGTASYDYAKSFDGIIRNFRIYNTTLTPEEIAQEYNAGMYKA